MASVEALTDPEWTGWIRLYNLTFIVGLAISFALFLGLNLIFPVSSLGLEADFNDTDSALSAPHDSGSDGTEHGDEKKSPVFSV